MARSVRSNQSVGSRGESPPMLGSVFSGTEGSAMFRTLEMPVSVVMRIDRTRPLAASRASDLK